MDLASKIVTGTALQRRAVLLKGASGTGKTYQYRTLVAEGYHPLYVDVEGKMPTIEDLNPPKWAIRHLDVPLLPTEVERMIQADQSDVAALVRYIELGQHEYDVVYFDSIMRYAEDLAAYLRYEKKLTGYDLWGIFAEKMRWVTKQITRLTSATKPVHVVVTTGVELSTDWQGQRAVVPLIDGRAYAPRIDYYFDDVLYLSKRTNAASQLPEYVMYTQGTAEVPAKISSGGETVPPLIVNPSLGKLLRQLEAHKRA
jgi:hypothetical protein